MYDIATMTIHLTTKKKTKKKKQTQKKTRAVLRIRATRSRAWRTVAVVETRPVRIHHTTVDGNQRVGLDPLFGRRPVEQDLQVRRTADQHGQVVYHLNDNIRAGTRG